MRSWLKGLLRGADGNTSISNFIMFVGLGVPFPFALTLCILVVLGKVTWPEKPMDWLLQYSVVVVLPYVFKMISYMSSKKVGAKDVG